MNMSCPSSSGGAALLTDRLNLPFQFFEYDTEDEIWFCRASDTECEL